MLSEIVQTIAVYHKHSKIKKVYVDLALGSP